MFISKKEYIELKQLNNDLKLENERLENKIIKLEDEKWNIKKEVENEHIENYNQHKKLLKIERLLNTSFGSFRNLLYFRTEVEKVIKNKLSATAITDNLK